MFCQISVASLKKVFIIDVFQRKTHTNSVIQLIMGEKSNILMIALDYEDILL